MTKHTERMLIDLARTNAPRRILDIAREASQLARERAAILAMFPGAAAAAAALDNNDTHTAPSAGNKSHTKPTRKRKIRSKAERLAISRRMKAYWKNKRNEAKQKEAKQEGKTQKKAAA